jgi:hypothetical protein
LDIPSRLGWISAFGWCQYILLIGLGYFPSIKVEISSRLKWIFPLWLGWMFPFDWVGYFSSTIVSTSVWLGYLPPSIGLDISFRLG